jgi:putative glutamine amidotransferase
MDRPKIGISACFMHPDATRTAFAKKTLNYVERSVPEWLMAGGALPVMIPPTDCVEAKRSSIAPDDYARWLDGLVLHGGADLWPGSYGEQPIDPRWQGDRERDAYETDLVKAFVAAGKPVFGICRGLQLINAAYGGTLVQDIPTQRPQALLHRDADLYDQLFHTLELQDGTRLAELLQGADSLKINSVHHQCIKELAPGFEIEARCPHDGTIEAIRHTGSAWIAAVQWHPEFHGPEHGTLDDRPLLIDFLQAALAARDQTS